MLFLKSLSLNLKSPCKIGAAVCWCRLSLLSHTVGSAGGREHAQQTGSKGSQSWNDVSRVEILVQPASLPGWVPRTDLRNNIMTITVIPCGQRDLNWMCSCPIFPIVSYRASGSGIQPQWFHMAPAAAPTYRTVGVRISYAKCSV